MITAKIETFVACLILVVILCIFGKYYEFPEEKAVKIKTNIAPITSS